MTSSELTDWQRLSRMTLPVSTIREIDAIAVNRFHMHSLVLMENAAIQCSEWIVKNLAVPDRIVLLCGKGNNGGDGFAIARHLRLQGRCCDVVALGPVDALSSDAKANWDILNEQYSPADPLGTNICLSADQWRDSFETADAFCFPQLSPNDVIIDAMLGSGATGAPKSPFSNWIQWANRSLATRVAIDIPTGLDAQRGTKSDCVFQADFTLTFVARKTGFDSADAQSVLGDVTVLPIGIPPALIRQIIDQSLSSVDAGGS